jgi:D-lactate dehydrogenase (cytochrome)
MDRTIASHESDNNVVVQPGVNWVQFNEQLRHTGLFFPIDPGMPAKIGGMVGTNCSGTHAFRYGTMRDWVMNLTIVLADGKIVKPRRRPPKTSAGYDLTSLLVGSEGTLGLATEITLKLAIIPETIRVEIVTVHDIDDAVSAVTEIVKQGPLLEAVELLDSRAACYLNTKNTSGLVWKEINTLLLKFVSASDQVSESVNRVKRILEHATIDSFEFSLDEEEAERIWSSRKRIATVVGGDFDERVTKSSDDRCGSPCVEVVQNNRYVVENRLSILFANSGIITHDKERFERSGSYPCSGNHWSSSIIL